MVHSMSRRRNSWDNAVTSFVATLRRKELKKRIYNTQEIARVNVFGYIEIFYNRIRHQSHLAGMISEASEAASK